MVKYLAFTRISPGKRSVIRISALGGTEQILADGSSQATWVDGESLVMVERAADGQSRLVRQMLETGARELVTSAPNGFTDAFPRVSPDGTRVAFQRYGQGRSAVFVVPLSGGELSTIMDWTIGIAGGLDWMPNGRELLIARPEMSGRRLVRVRADGHSEGVPVPLLPPEVVTPSVVSRSPTATSYRLAVSSGYPDVGLRLVDLRGPRAGTTITGDSPFCDSSRIDSPGRFSPDGTQVAFVSDRSGNQQIYVANRDGSGLRAVTQFQSATVNVGSWSPNGQAVTFDATTGNTTDIYIVSLNSGGLTHVTQEPAVEIDPEWSRDGQWIYYSSNASGQPTIWKRPVNGGAAVRLTTETGFEPREAPDGTVYFIGRPRQFGLGAPSVLMRIAPGGGPVEKLPVAALSGAWEVTDRGIVFAAMDDGAGSVGTPTASRLHFYDFHSGTIEPLGDLRFPLGPFGVPHFLTVSRDGRWALASRVDRWPRDILLVDGYR